MLHTVQRVNKKPPQTLLVTGASGHLGRRVIELLLDNGAGPIIATTRNPEQLMDFAEQGVQVREADFDHPEGLEEAFFGANRMLLISTSALDRPGRRARQHRAAVQAAKQVGVQHIVYTSMTHPDPQSPVVFAPDHWATELALAKSGMTWTVLRNNVYADFLLPFLPRALEQGELVAAVGEGGAAFVSREDCARAAAAALASRNANNRVLEITGPAVVSFNEIAMLLSELTGHQVTYLPVKPSALRASFLKAHMPTLKADALVSIHLAMAREMLGPATSAVEYLTGRKSESVAQFLAQRINFFEPVWPTRVLGNSALSFSEVQTG